MGSFSQDWSISCIDKFSPGDEEGYGGGWVVLGPGFECESG